MSKATTTSPASVVRAWAEGQDSITSGYGSRGRISVEVQEAFNAAHPDAPYAKASPHTVDITVRLLNSKGKEYPVTKHLTPAEIKTRAGRAGAKGSLSKEVVALATQSLQDELRAAKANA